MPQCITSAATCRRYEKPTGVGFANCAAGFRGSSHPHTCQRSNSDFVLALGLPEDKVRVISPYIGGAFGQRGSISPHTILAAVAARRVGRPVKLTVPRAQIFHATSFRAATEHHIRIGADRDGRFVAGMHLVRAQTSRFDLMPFTGEETTSRTYAWAAFRGATTLVQLDTQTPSFMRAPMEMAPFFALESAVDELAEKLAMDPVALRTLNDAKADPISGKPFSSRNLVQCLQRGAERFGWSRRKHAPRSMRLDDGTLVGWASRQAPIRLTSHPRSRAFACMQTVTSISPSARTKWDKAFAARLRLLRRKNSACLPVSFEFSSAIDCAAAACDRRVDWRGHGIDPDL